MAGQPNRKPGVPGVPLVNPATGKSLGMKSLEAQWEPTSDAAELADRLRRKSMQVEKLKRERGELKIAMKLKTEEAYNEGLLSVAPKLLAIDQKVADITEKLLTAEIGEDELKLLKALLPELSKQRDRLYGKTRQRVESTSSAFTADLTELMNRSRVSPQIDVGLDAVIVDVEPEDEELIDE